MCRYVSLASLSFCLCAGCAMWGGPAMQPFAMPAAPVVTPGAAPTTVAPGAGTGQPTQSNKPETPVPAKSAPSETTPPQSPSGGTPEPTASDTPPASASSPASPNAVIEQKTQRPALEVPAPQVEEEAPPAENPTAPSILDNWKETPAGRAQPITPLPPIDRAPATAPPAGAKLGEPSPFPQLPSRPEAESPPAAAPSSPEPSGQPVTDPPTAGITTFKVSTTSPEKPSTAPLRPSGWELQLQSTARRPLQTALAGSGDRKVLILGSLSGLETESVQLLDQTLQILTTGDLPPVQLFLLRTPNPDGIAEHTRTNLNGVDLNRNFPSTQFTVSPNQQTGPYPASEIEIQHVLRILREQAPHRVIHVRSGIGQRTLVLMNERAARALMRADLPKNADYAVYSGDLKAGSIEEFAATRMEVETVTVMLPLEGFEQFQPGDLLKLASTSVGADTTPAVPTELTAAQNAPSAVIPSGPQPDGALGFVEILPPPTESLPVQGAGDPRYYELPPPPR